MGKSTKRKRDKGPKETLDTQPTTRKGVRKEQRKLVKLRRKAFCERDVIPTPESLQQQRVDKVKAILKTEKNTEARKRKRFNKRKAKEAEIESVKQERQAVTDALNTDKREITKYEKLLRLNKRKSKTISQGFKNDGLDYLLEALDSELLQSLADKGEEEGLTESALGALDSMDAGDGSDMSDDENESGSDGEKVGQENESESDQAESESGEQMDVDGPEVGSDVGESSDGDDEDYSGYHWPSDQEEEEEEGSTEEKTARQIAKAINKQDTKSQSSAAESILKDPKTKQKKVKTKNAKKSVHFDNDTPIVQTSKENGKGSSKNKTKASTDEPPAKKIKKAIVEEQGKTNTDSNNKTNINKHRDVSSDELDSGSASEEEVGDNFESLSDNSGSADEQEADDKKPKLKEDIYGRLRDDRGNVVTSQAAYVPPGRRLAMMSENSEKRKFEVERITRLLKGQFNRLSERNMQPIAMYIQGLFRSSYTRGDLTESLSAILMESLVSTFPVPERLITEHCLLLAILHSEIGTEIGATFLQILVKKFDTLLKSGGNYGQGKEMDNIVVVLAHLCNFKVLNCLLMYDVMKKFAESFQEKDIDLLLIIFRNAGVTLRKEDPLALKEFITFVQSKAVNVDASKKSEQSSRMQFMLEVINHIKNNNLRKIPNYDHTHVEQLKKLLHNCTGSRVSEGELRISLVDILASDERGKWWVVGSAWTGRETDDADDVTAGKSSAGVSDNDSKILELARQQRMNTDVRKNIFCTIVTSEDYIDAFEKLLHLGLKHQQEREIMHVIVDICLQEKQFNPFYAYLANKFCLHNRKFQMSAQYNLWDKFKALETLGEKKMTNLASFTAHLISNKSLALSVFKVIEFAELDKTRMAFMKLVLSSVLLESEDAVIQEVFLRISSVKKLHIMCEGLKLFLKHFLRKGKMKNELLDAKIKIAEDTLDSKNVKLRM